MGFQETGTKITWSNPTYVPESQRQSGGWYANPATGSVDRWWSGGTSAPSVPTPTSTTDYRSDLTSLMAQRRAENAGLQADYESAQTKYSGELGIPGLNTQLSTVRGEVSKVKDLLSQLEGDITQRTTGLLFSEPQRRRLLAAEETPLRTQLGSLVAGQESAAGQLSQAYTELDRRLSPLLQKIGSDRDLSEDEWQLASTLAQQENAFEREKEKMRLQNQLDISKTSAANPTMTQAEWEALMRGGGSGAGGTSEPRPLYSAMYIGAKSPKGQWTFNGVNWTPAGQATNYFSTLDQIFGIMPGTAGASATLR